LNNGWIASTERLAKKAFNFQLFIERASDYLEDGFLGRFHCAPVVAQNARCHIPGRRHQFVVRYDLPDHIHRKRALRVDRFARKFHFERNSHAASIYQAHCASISRMHTAIR
jgi:hypothetical protein